jgi:amidase
MNEKDITSLDAHALSDAIKNRKVSCREVMQSYLDRIDRVNPGCNAIVSLQPRETLLAQADERDTQLARGQWLGWMHGMPQAIKDLALTAGIPSTFGSPLYANHVPQVDGLIVERVKNAGAIIIGKTNTPEFGYGSQTYNMVFGATRNAWNRNKCAGGSSGGAAVALALNLLPVADGSDMGGSLRNPAAFNNVFGFRPSAGRVPKWPANELFMDQLGVEGPMGRTVSDVARLLSIQAGYDPRVPLSLGEDPAVFAQPLQALEPGARIGWLGDFDRYLPMEDGVLELCRGALGRLQTAGYPVEEAKLGFEPERLWSMWLALRSASIAGGKANDYQDPVRRAQLKPEAIWEVENSLSTSAGELYRASIERSAWYQHMLKMFDRYDFLALPSAQVFPFDVSTHWPSQVAGRAMDTYHRWMEVVIGPTLAGLPVISVPVGFSEEGLPMGMQLIGRPRGDLEVLRLAQAYELMTDWWRQSPPDAP